MRLKTFILLTASILNFSILAVAQQTYTVKGFVVDSHSNEAVKDAQVWLYGKQTGGITDSHGQYEFKVFKMYSDTRLYVRACGDKIATSKLVSFGADTLIQVDFSINGIENDCIKPPNIPWKVSPSEYENYQGYLILDMHGVFIRTCRGNSYSPVWPSDFRMKGIWPDNSQYGDSLFIQLEGRLDPYSKDIVPFQNLYVGKIDSISSIKTAKCNKN
ncbi:hypothetical protein ACKGJO_02805 [Gracilimonas sp. Q87]|uniref:hypothetical protein n=1 Tax=Gracilimonas sp. Q87 TaxID=3384766 RepID=UPI003983F31F